MKMLAGGNWDEATYYGFLEELVEAGYLEGAALGITKRVIHEGRDSLTENQDYVFERYVLGEYVRDKCNVCHQTIPWCEKFQAIQSGLCAACLIR